MRKELIKLINQNSKMSFEYSDPKIYYLTENDWYDIDDNIVSDAILSARLSKSFNSKTNVKNPKFSEGLIYNFELSIVLHLTIKPKTQKNTFKKIEEKFNTVVYNSKHEYFATHDSLTGLINGRMFDEKLIEYLDDVKLASNSMTSTNNDLVCTFILDIDHFKQVNDSFGHEYGDIALFIFAKRLEEIKDTIINKYNTRIKVAIGRCGGEEFKIAIKTSLSKIELKDISEKFRSSIEKYVLPTEKEWNSLPANLKSSSSVLPHDADRKVTTSIGVSSFMETSNSDSAKVSKILQKEADLALYRAKAGGRNIVRYYNDIKDKYGSIISYHEDTDIITIDLGENFGIKKGDEFLVYHPDFIGGIPLEVNDGRSTKCLGYYPRISYGKIRVNNVQNEIAFCVHSEKNCIRKYLQGSQLEFIKIGAISSFNINDHEPDSISYIQSIEDIKSYLLEKDKHGSDVAILSFYITNLDEIKEDVLSFRINSELNNLITLLRTKIPDFISLHQFEEDRYSLIYDGKKSFDLKDKLTILLDELSKSNNNLFKVNFSIFALDSISYDDLNDNSNLSIKNSLFYTQQSILSMENTYNENLNNYQIEDYSHDIFYRVISKLRKQKKYNEIYDYYNELKDNGINNAQIDNLLTITYLEENKIEEALITAENALQINPDNSTFIANYALTQSFKNNWIKSLEAYEQFITHKPIYNLKGAYLFSYAWCNYFNFINNNVEIDFVSTKNSLEENITNRELFNISMEDVSDAIKLIDANMHPE